MPNDCPLPPISRSQEILDNAPYLLMLLLGAALWLGLPVQPWAWLAAVAYFAYGIAGAFWIMIFVCPYCHFHGTRLCPCGYGQLAARLQPRRDGTRFREQFRRHLPVIVPLWFLPLIPAALTLVRQFSWWTLTLAAAFVLNAFVVLPLVSRYYGCASCPQKETCPWMGGCKQL
ncbi:MAG TPA: hypothetical protein PKX23_04000 [Verrucomicrobiota bacterium]|jgi:hypothetical protein|nr:hypothetical protein [Verrucomicrobiota bacterium]HRT56513.1 hypothetical protein [Candidatus Paceibacterota bacterium]